MFTEEKSEIMNSILDILENVNNDEPKKFYKFVDKSILKETKQFIVTANPEIIMMGRNNDDMNRVLKKAVVIPDGIGVVKALGILSKRASRNTGIDLVNHLLNVANERTLKVFIYGSKEETLKDFEDVCTDKWSNIKIVGLYNGYTSKKEEVISKIKESNCDIVLVALGTPKQELFIDTFYDDISKGICVGIGGSIDVLSGNVKRAPKFFLKCNLEWLYRITTDPKRLKRFWNGNIVFIFVLFKEMIRKKMKK